MRIDVFYSENRSYGTGVNVPKYRATIGRRSNYRRGVRTEDIEVRFDFDRPAFGKDLSTQSTAHVERGTLLLSPREAENLAHGILSFLFFDGEFEKVVLECDEDRFVRK